MGGKDIKSFDVALTFVLQYSTVSTLGAHVTGRNRTQNQTRTLPNGIQMGMFYMVFNLHVFS